MDPLAEDYHPYNIYSYVVSNPINLIDPNGMEWINPYEGREGFEDEYNKVNVILKDLQANDEELYDYIDNLTFTDENGRESKLRVVVYLSSEKEGEDNQDAEVSIGFSGVKGEYDGNTIDVPYSNSFKNRSNVMGGDKSFSRAGIINVLLYGGGQDDSSLANEAGDVMFAMEYNDIAKEDDAKSYYDRATTQYSFKVQDAFENRKAGRLSKTRKIYPLIYLRGKITPNDGGSFKDR